MLFLLLLLLLLVLLLTFCVAMLSTFVGITLNDDDGNVSQLKKTRGWKVQVQFMTREIRFDWENDFIH